VIEFSKTADPGTSRTGKLGNCAQSKKTLIFNEIRWTRGTMRTYQDQPSDPLGFALRHVETFARRACLNRKK